MNDVPIFYINLATATGRRTAIERQFANLGLSAERVDAIVPADISSEMLAEYCDPDRYHWLTPVELACTLSHAKVWRQMLQADLRLGLIFEDDAVLSAHLPAFLQALRVGRPDLSLAKIEICPDPIRAEPEAAFTIGEIEFRRVYGFSGGAAGYIISDGAIRSLIEEPDFYRNSLDRCLFDAFGPFSRRLAFLQAEPALAIQADQMPGATSSLEASALKPDLDRRFNTRNRSILRRYLHSSRRWIDTNIHAGLQKSYLDATGIKKRSIQFMP